jgi:hypothetical protein
LCDQARISESFRSRSLALTDHAGCAVFAYLWIALTIHPEPEYVGSLGLGFSTSSACHRVRRTGSADVASQTVNSTTPAPRAVADALRRVTDALPGRGEDRPGQVEMAEAVAVAILDRRHLIVQAGTGTGKSLAYLIPALLLGEKVVVARATT